MPHTAPAPKNACPKCGETGWRGPTYQPAQAIEGRSRNAEPRIVRESLLWACSTCGYPATTPTNETTRPIEPEVPTTDVEVIRDVVDVPVPDGPEPGRNT
jgi:ribosomal protein L37AE/L43A